MSAASWPQGASPRTIVLRGRLDDAQANLLIAELLTLEARDAAAPVTFVVDGPPGSLRAALTVMDTLGYVRMPIATGCRSRAGLSSLALLAAGTRGRRWALPHATFMLAEPHEGPAMSLAEANERAVDRAALLSRLASDTGTPLAQLERDLSERRLLTAQEAQTYGLIDQVSPEPGTA